MNNLYSIDEDLADQIGIRCKNAKTKKEIASCVLSVFNDKKFKMYDVVERGFVERGQEMVNRFNISKQDLYAIVKDQIN